MWNGGRGGDPLRCPTTYVSSKGVSVGFLRHGGQGGYGFSQFHLGIPEFLAYLTEVSRHPRCYPLFHKMKPGLFVNGRVIYWQWSHPPCETLDAHVRCPHFGHFETTGGLDGWEIFSRGGERGGYFTPSYPTWRAYSSSRSFPETSTWRFLAHLPSLRASSSSPCLQGGASQGPPSQ